MFSVVGEAAVPSGRSVNVAPPSTLQSTETSAGASSEASATERIAALAETDAKHAPKTGATESVGTTVPSTANDAGAAIESCSALIQSADATPS